MLTQLIFLKENIQMYRYIFCVLKDTEKLAAVASGKELDHWRKVWEKFYVSPYAFLYFFNYKPFISCCFFFF